MPASDQLFIEKVNQLVDDNLDKSTYSMDNLCRDLGISRSQLFRSVKEQKGVSPALYIRHRRLIVASQLLCATSLRIAEIANRVGMDSPQSFTKAFTQEFGSSPTDYRKNNPIYQSKPLLDPVETSVGAVIDPVAAIPTEPVIQPLSFTQPTSSLKYRRSFLAWGLGVLMLLIIGIGVYVGQPNPPARFEPSLNAIAVLPFKNLGSSETTFFADGLMGQAHASLALVEGLKVISKTSSMLFQNSPKSIPAVASELGVSYLLTGTVAQASNHVRISVELIQAREDQTIWTTTYNGDARNAVKFMNDVAKTVARKLNQKLSQSTARQIDKLPTKNWDAYNAYLEGQKLMQSREKAKLEASIRKFDRAIALDTSFADAYAYRASAYFVMVSFAFMDQSMGVKMAEQSALDAIRLDATNGTAYAVLAGAYKIQFKWEQAITTYQIALKHSPNNAQINYWYSLVLRSLGRFDEAIRYGAKAVEYDPLSAIILVGYINSCSYTGDFAQAKKAIDRGALLFDKEYMYYYAQATYYLLKKEYKASIREFQHADVLSRYPTNASDIAYCQAKLGRKDLAGKYVDTLAHTPNNYISLATVYAGLGDKEQCFTYLQRAADQGLMPDYVNISPVFSFLHNDPRYPALLRQFGLQDTHL